MTTARDYHNEIATGKMTIDDLTRKIAEAEAFAEQQGFLEMAYGDIGTSQSRVVWLMEMKEMYDRDGTKGWLHGPADSPANTRAAQMADPDILEKANALQRKIENEAIMDLITNGACCDNPNLDGTHPMDTRTININITTEDVQGMMDIYMHLNNTLPKQGDSEQQIAADRRLVWHAANALLKVVKAHPDTEAIKDAIDLKIDHSPLTNNRT